LSCVATTDGNGNEALLVINNTPNTYVQAQINPTLASYNEVNSWTLGAAGSDSFLSYNTPSDPNNVTLRTSSASFQRGALAASFPPSSVTVMRFSKVGGSVPPSGGGSGTTTTTVTPTIPTGLQATHATTTSVTLAWNPSTDSQGVLRGYNIDENGNHLTAIDNTGTSYTVTGLTPGTSYYFSVSAFNTNGQTSIPAPRIQVSTEAASTAPTAPTTVTPSIPTNLRATAETTSSVTIAWNPSTDSVGTMAGYNIIENAVHLTAISPSETSYTVTGLTTKTSYYFSVAAYNTTGQTSVPASRIQVTTK
jgi:chitodextrinase